VPIELAWLGGVSQPRKKPRLFALIVGVGTNAKEIYKPDGSADLKTPVDDADDIAAQLNAEEKSTFEFVEMRGLKDRQAIPNIKAGLSWLRRWATEPEDIALVYFSGHGMSISGGHSYLLPAEFNKFKRGWTRAICLARLLGLTARSWCLSTPVSRRKG
jgi:hypothetical protein